MKACIICNKEGGAYPVCRACFEKYNIPYTLVDGGFGKKDTIAMDEAEVRRFIRENKIECAGL